MKSIAPLLVNTELRIQSEVTDNTTQLHSSSLAQQHTYQCIVVPMIVVTMVCVVRKLRISCALNREYIVLN